MSVTPRAAPRTPAAERQLRRRRHKAGDHSLCLSANCDKAGQSSPTVIAGGRGERGARLWAEMADGLSPAQRVLLEEACRIADRLDRLDDLIEGGRDQWLHLSGVDGEVRVVVDALLAETRQQATALRGLMAEITKGSSSARPARPAPKKGAGVADISSRIAARRGTTAG